MTTNKSCPFLHKLPREIRDQIYRNLFESPTGSIELMKSHSHSTHFDIYTTISSDYSQNRYQKIDLSLIQVCKKTHEECKDLVWKYNNLVLGPSDHYFRSESFGRVQNIRLELDLSYGALLEETRECFELLGKWAKTGSSKKVTLHAAQSREMMECLVEARGFGIKLRRGGASELENQTWQNYMMLLRDCQILLGPGICRRISVDVGWNYRFSRFSQEMWLRKVVDLETLQGVIRDLHEAFDGELWQDGTMCWKNGVQVAEPFQLAALKQ